MLENLSLKVRHRCSTLGTGAKSSSRGEEFYPTPWKCSRHLQSNDDLLVVLIGSSGSHTTHSASVSPHAGIPPPHRGFHPFGSCNLKVGRSTHGSQSVDSVTIHLVWCESTLLRRFRSFAPRGPSGSFEAFNANLGV